tara:strand:- start:3735 stop:5462 length:1728 start_codon:yes stop_codon:yes gene_type:complete
MARETKKIKLSAWILSFVALGTLLSPHAANARLLEEEQIQVETYAKLREIERYQLKIAQKFYEAKDYVAAASEYEKFLTLYERSPGGPYSLLMWAHCQVKLRLVNTAIRDGFQSVIDYWPESNEAIIANFMIGRCHALNGEPRKAEKAFQQLLEDHPKHVNATRACEEMLVIAANREDIEKQVELWTSLVFQTPSNRHTPHYASKLAQYHFRESEFDKGIEAIEKIHGEKERAFIEAVHSSGNAVTRELFAKDESQPRAKALGAELISFLEERLPGDVSEKKAEGIARETLDRIAQVHATLDQDKQVIATYERMGKKLGMDDSILGSMAEWHKRKDRREQARSVYRRYKDKQAGLRAVANSYVEENQYGQARSVYALYSDKVEGRLAIAKSYRSERNWKEAVKNYLSLIALDKERESSWQKNVVDTWREASEWDKAIDTYRELLNVDPDRHSDWYWGMAECYEKKKKWSEAIQAYRQTDNYPEGYFRMAECNKELKKWPEGLVMLNQAKSHKNVGDRAQFRIAQFYEMAGHKEKCIKAFQMTCKLYPKSSYASRAHAYLQTEYGINVTLGGSTDK